MGRKAIIIAVVVIMAGLIATEGYLISKSRVFAGLNPGNILADICVPVLPCGGVLISPPAPCIGSGFEWAHIKTAFGITINYIFEPTPFLYYLPTHVGQFFVGNDLPNVCNCLTLAHQGLTGPCGTVYGTSV